MRGEASLKVEFFDGSLEGVDFEKVRLGVLLEFGHVGNEVLDLP